MDKLLHRPELLKDLTYSQFVKRCTNTTSVPNDYNFEKIIREKLTQKDIDNEDYIFTGETANVGDTDMK